VCVCESAASAQQGKLMRSVARKKKNDDGKMKTKNKKQKISQAKTSQKSGT
jgi:hypothetical protein